MNLHRFALAGLTLPLIVAACASPGDEPTAAASQDMTAEWLASNIPPGSAIERKVLALVNDSTMTQDRYVSECAYSTAVAQNILAYRSGDTTEAADDQRFDTTKELDALPLTNATFWADTVRCAMLHVAGPSVCPPGSHPPVILELVIDESGSMTGDKWAATRDSLLALIDEIHASGDPNVLVGAQLFNDVPTKKVRPEAMTTEHHGDLVELIDKPNPGSGGTGIEKVLTAAYRTVDGVPQAAMPGARKIVVLLSDGVPMGGETEKQASIQLVQAAQATGVETYAVGIGEFPTGNPGMYDPAFMGALASVGGTAPAGCDVASTDLASVCHVQITPSGNVEDLETALSNAFHLIQNRSVAPSCP